MSSLTIKDDMKATHAALKQMKGAFSNLLPENMSARKFATMACLAVNDNPELLKCNRGSLYNAFFTAARLSLWPDGVTGECYFVIFKDKVQLLPGYKGWIKLCHFSGVIERMTASEVREDDFFDWEKGSRQFLRHKPSGNLESPITYFYAYCKTTIGGEFFEVRTKEQVDRHRDKFSLQWKNSKKPKRELIWSQHYVKMGQKTLIHMLMPSLPKDNENRMILALRCDAAESRNEVVSSKDHDVIDVEYLVVPPDGREVENVQAENPQTARLDAAFASRED